MDKSLENKDVRKKLYIKVYYSMLDWEWYDDANTFRVFMHLMFIANRNAHPYHGDVIHRGEALASLEFIAKSLNISVRNVRTAIEHLKATQEITTRKIDKTSVIRLNNYNKYQRDNRITDNEVTTNRQRTDNEVTTSRQRTDNELTTLKDCKSDKNDILKECESHARTHEKHNNVLLTKGEYERFRDRYPSIADKVIEELSDKVATGDPKYQTGHIGHLYVFARNYKQQEEYSPPSFDIDLAIKRSLKIDPTKVRKDK